LLRETLQKMGRADLIGEGENQLIPAWQSGEEEKNYRAPRRKNSAQSHHQRKEKNKARRGKSLTQHTGLPPRET
jgi:hypothetical protein